MLPRRLLSLLLVLLMTASCGIGCAQSAAETETETEAETAPAAETETVPEETETKISDELPESDFEGYEFVIFNSNPESNDWFTTVHVTAEEDSGEAIPSAIFNRNLQVEDRLNIRISEVEQNAAGIKNAITAGDGAFDISLMQGINVISFAQNGYLHDMFTLPYQDFDKPWWDANAVEQLSICGKLFIGVGDFLTTQIDETICTFFNRRLIDNHSLEDPYLLVEEGRWTLDMFQEMGTTAANDTDGNGEFNDRDSYGSISWRGVMYMYLFYGSGQSITAKDENDVPAFTFYNEQFVNAYEKILSIMHGEPGFFYDADINKNTRGLALDHRVQEIMFPAGQAMFWVECISWAKALREMDADFGILPAPKLNEEQTEYYSCNNGNFFGISVPVSVSDLDRTSIILEALNSHSTDTVLAAYYDVTLKTKYSRDEESSKMVDLIFATTTYDCSTVFSIGSVKINLYTMASNNNPDLASYYNRQSKNLTTQITRIVEKIEALDD